jgi:aldehyde dehydrogenase (NAD+)
MSTTSTMIETSMDVIETIFKDIRESFNTGKTKSLSWRKRQIEQIYKMFDEQKDAFAAAVNADFHRPKSETLLFDCGSVNYFFHSYFMHNFIHLDS